MGALVAMTHQKTHSPPFTVGVVEGGEPRNLALRRTVARLLEIRDGLNPPASESPGRELRVNVIYNVPGDIWPVRFTGIEKGAFSSRRRLLAVQVAVPGDLRSDDVTSYVSDTLRQAVAIAEAEAERRNLSANAARALAEASLVELDRD
jgi:hypothetical protein